MLEFALSAFHPSVLFGGDIMGNEGRESTRGIAKRKLQSCSNRLTEASKLLGEIHLIYEKHNSPFGKGFELIIKMITMVEAMVIDIRDKL